jgi:cyanophycinase-like exopeptidase
MKSPGGLALVGSGEYLPAMEVVDRELLDCLPESPRIVCLPTAAGSEGAARVDYWCRLGEQYFTEIGVSVESLPIVDHASANDASLVARIREANFIYFSGGRPTYLLAVLKNSLAWQAVLNLLEEGGIVAGCSAGAMIMGERIPSFPTWQRAFNLFPGRVVVPHYDEIPPAFARTMKLFISRQRRLVGIDGSTALFIKNGSCRVLGAGYVTTWDQHGIQRFGSGEQFVLN